MLKPPSPITVIEVLNPTLPKEYFDDKGVILDLLIRLADQSLVNVEMQMANIGYLRSRSLLYWARTYEQQLVCGDSYKQLNPTATIFFLNFLEFKGQPTQYHWTFQVRERNPPHPLFLDHLEIHFIELPRLKLSIADDESSCDNPELGIWRQFLTARSAQEIEELAMAHPVLRDAKDALAKVSKEKENRYAAEARWRGIIDVKSQIEEATDKGRAEGRQEGIQQGRLDGVKKEAISIFEVKYNSDPTEIATAITEIQCVDTINEIVALIKRTANKEEIMSTVRQLKNKKTQDQ